MLAQCVWTRSYMLQRSPSRPHPTPTRHVLTTVLLMPPTPPTPIPPTQGRDLERTVLAKAVRWHLSDRVIVHNNKTVVFE